MIRSTSELSSLIVMYNEVCKNKGVTLAQLRSQGKQMQADLQKEISAGNDGLKVDLRNLQWELEEIDACLDADKSPLQLADENFDKAWMDLEKAKEELAVVSGHLSAYRKAGRDPSSWDRLELLRKNVETAEANLSRAKDSYIT